MITPMKKISLMIFYQEYESFLEGLKDKGVVHIHENKERSAHDEQLHLRLSQIKRLNELIQRMKSRGQIEKSEVVHLDTDEHLDEHLKKKFHRLEQIQQQLGVVQKELTLYESWGDFSEEQIAKLKEAGWNIDFYFIPEQKFKEEWEEDPGIVEISLYKGQKYFVSIYKDSEKPEIEAEPFVFPDAGKDEILAIEENLQEEYRHINHYLDDISVDAIQRLEKMREIQREITDEIHVKNASQVIVDEKIIALEGWVPVDKKDDLVAFLDDKEVYYEITGSTKDDDVPVKLKNNKFSRLFEPIGDMYDLPNYSELDLTPFFAPFFMLFFGLCMGDGGYGLLIWLTCLFLIKKVPVKMRGYLKLGQYLGFTTMVVGILTGSFFGIALDSVTWPWLQGVKQYFLTQDNFGEYFGGYNPMMFVAFGLGIIQILFGMCLNVAKIVKQHGFKYALSEMGWVVLLVTLIVMFGLPMLGVHFPTFFQYLFYGLLGISALAIFFFNSPDKNIIVNFGAGIWNTYNMATGLLGDILSYVRLFALGLTGSILGSVFNMLALDMTASMPVVARFIVAFLILIVGHALNFAIAMIGALVHPMRLTFVEFYKNAGFEGMGKRYSPFRKRT